MPALGVPALRRAKYLNRTYITPGPAVPEGHFASGPRVSHPGFVTTIDRDRACRRLGVPALGVPALRRAKYLNHTYITPGPAVPEVDHGCHTQGS